MLHWVFSQNFQQRRIEKDKANLIKSFYAAQMAKQLGKLSYPAETLTQ